MIHLKSYKKYYLISWSFQSKTIYNSVPQALLVCEQFENRKDRRNHKPCCPSKDEFALVNLYNPQNEV